MVTCIIIICILLLISIGINYLDNNEELTKLSFIILIGFIIIGGIIYKYNNFEKEIKSNTFYDGEGNKIPNHIVELKVKSCFSKMKQSEKDSINKYFYLDTLK